MIDNIYCVIDCGKKRHYHSIYQQQFKNNINLVTYDWEYPEGHLGKDMEQ